MERRTARWQDKPTQYSLIFAPSTSTSYWLDGSFESRIRPTQHSPFHLSLLSLPLVALAFFPKISSDSALSRGTTMFHMKMERQPTQKPHQYYYIVRAFFCSSYQYQVCYFLRDRRDVHPPPY
ncbi:hypothetical protein NL676_007936 [Syzygium grande]|nr:hypothetical protein NL676_007936 [Syzygium grande]